MHWTAAWRLCFILHVIGPPPVMCIVGPQRGGILDWVGLKTRESST